MKEGRGAIPALRFGAYLNRESTSFRGAKRAFCAPVGTSERRGICFSPIYFRKADHSLRSGLQPRAIFCKLLRRWCSIGETAEALAYVQKRAAIVIGGLPDIAFG